MFDVFELHAVAWGTRPGNLWAFSWYIEGLDISSMDEWDRKMLEINRNGFTVQYVGETPGGKE